MAENDDERVDLMARALEESQHQEREEREHDLERQVRADGTLADLLATKDVDETD